ncbi:hypothetical protein [Streptomyces sp. NPDC001292]|uniref:hypothetical protein n=1 Tax=Streptomyces sp. NPDC001292 TaxID=3364558 RepID=UPI003673ABC9
MSEDHGAEQGHRRLHLLRYVHGQGSSARGITEVEELDTHGRQPSLAEGGPGAFPHPACLKEQGGPRRAVL